MVTTGVPVRRQAAANAGPCGRTGTAWAARAAQIVRIGLGLVIGNLAVATDAPAQAGAPLIDGRSAVPAAAVGSAGWPAQRTALATRPELRFVLGRQLHAGRITQVLAWMQADGVPVPVAQVHQVSPVPAAPPLPGGTAPTVQVRLLARSGAADPPGLRLATLEQLYSLVLRQDPLAGYCLQTEAPVTAAPPADCSEAPRPHAAALRTLAALRAQALPMGATATPWRMVALETAAPLSWDADSVGVQAHGPDGPLAGLTVYFHRAPHSICQAHTGADGVARCRLEDQHADGHQHDHAAAVIVTFPGDLRPERVLLPTTQVLRPHADPLRPAFASRWELSGTVAMP